LYLFIYSFETLRTKWKRQACLGLELFAGATLQRWIQRQPHLLAAAAAAYRPSGDVSSAMGPFGSALLSEAKSVVAGHPNAHMYAPSSLTLHRQE
jgi:hypothetical protein